jgi:environmental stress-induced protein Ves
MRIIRAADCRRMPWKNGGGETIEVALSPAGASIDDFDWRVSMARVAAPGPFSIFAGVDRTLAVLEGAGVALRLAGRGEVRLDPDAAPFAFPGDLPVDAALLDGPIDDLNVMTRRGRYRHLLAPMRIGAPAAVPRYGETMIFLVKHGGAEVRASGRGGTLQPRDAVILDRADGAELWVIPAGSAEVFVTDLWRC